MCVSIYSAVKVRTAYSFLTKVLPQSMTVHDTLHITGGGFGSPD